MKRLAAAARPALVGRHGRRPGAGARPPEAPPSPCLRPGHREEPHRPGARARARAATRTAAQGRRDPFVSLLKPVVRIAGRASGGRAWRASSSRRSRSRGSSRTRKGYIAMLLGTDGKSYFVQGRSAAVRRGHHRHRRRDRDLPAGGDGSALDREEAGTSRRPCIRPRRAGNESQAGGRAVAGDRWRSGSSPAPRRRRGPRPADHHRDPAGEPTTRSTRLVVDVHRARRLHLLQPGSADPGGRHPGGGRRRKVPSRINVGTREVESVRVTSMARARRAQPRPARGPPGQPRALPDLLQGHDAEPGVRARPRPRRPTPAHGRRAPRRPRPRRPRRRGAARAGGPRAEPPRRDREHAAPAPPRRAVIARPRRAPPAPGVAHRRRDARPTRTASSRSTSRPTARSSTRTSSSATPTVSSSTSRT